MPPTWLRAWSGSAPRTLQPRRPRHAEPRFRSARDGHEPVAARSVRRATGAGVLLRARRLEVGGLGSQAGGPRPQPRVSDGDGNPRWAPRPVRMDILPRATGPGGNGLRRLLYEPARLRRLRRALPPRRRARLGRQGLSPPDELARPAH